MCYDPHKPIEHSVCVYRQFSNCIMTQNFFDISDVFAHFLFAIFRIHYGPFTIGGDGGVGAILLFVCFGSECRSGNVTTKFKWKTINISEKNGKMVKIVRQCAYNPIRGQYFLLFIFNSLCLLPPEHNPSYTWELFAEVRNAKFFHMRSSWLLLYTIYHKQAPILSTSA